MWREKGVHILYLKKITVAPDAPSSADATLASRRANKLSATARHRGRRAGDDGDDSG